MNIDKQKPINKINEIKNEIKKVLILGSSALKIGEAGEFDYSGSQAIKALKEEGIYTVLVNPNIATNQTSQNMADQIYFLPVKKDFVEKIIVKERPDAILLGFGGQTALNCGIQLYKEGILEQYDVTVLGTSVETILDTEDRARFVNRLDEINVPTPVSKTAETVEEALTIASDLGYPVMIRIAFALGGLGSGICKNEKQLRTMASKAFAYTSQILIEEYLVGWKEIEYEVMRDGNDNCITVCNMENFDPLGIHTGESIVVAPSQTLSNPEYHLLRETAIKVIRHLDIVGECNIQYAVDPNSDQFRVIEVNARLSRSSALASKATGYPLAFVAAKVVLGFGLHEISNNVTGTSKAFFEPALDYIVVKAPRWDLKKFQMVSRHLGSGMKSIGEVMAIGRNFEEALQKALRMLETGANGLIANDNIHFDNIEDELQHPTDVRILAIAQALKEGFSIEKIQALSHIDPWFLEKLKNIIDIADSIEQQAKEEQLNFPLLQNAKQAGFSDKQIAILQQKSAAEIRDLRHRYNLRPFIKQIDTLGAEYPAQTNYLYLTYNGIEDDIQFKTTVPDVIILGSGSYRIGSSVEFDWCSVRAGYTLRDLGYQTTMINYNPETVSTDYDEFDNLFFDEITLESVSEISDRISPLGVIVSLSGQIPNNLALDLHKAGIPVLGTSPLDIDRAEDRNKFSSLLDRLNIDQPPWEMLESPEDAKKFAIQVGYPILVRPSYVLSGSAMAVATNEYELDDYLEKASLISREHPVIISKFLENAKEVEVDAVAQGGEIVTHAVLEHVENAGVHSGDATIVLPPQRTYLETIRRIRKISAQIALHLNINGPFNIQFLAKDNDIKVIECNLRASRSFPFVSKVLNIDFAEIATKVMLNRPIPRKQPSLFELNHVGVKAPQFSITRLENADPVLGVEMASTGEVGCLGDDFEEAFLKSLISVGYRFPIKSILLSSGSIESKSDLLESTKLWHQQGIKLYATRGTARFLNQHKIPVEILNWPNESEKPNTIEYIKEGLVDLVVNIPKNYQPAEMTNSYLIRRTAIDHNIPLITNRQIAKRLAETLNSKSLKNLKIKSWSEYLK